MKTVSFHSLGCRVNQYEEQALRELFLKNGYAVVPFGEKCEVCVVNTCAVTAESERKSRNMISRAKRFSGQVIATGCYAELVNQLARKHDDSMYFGGCKQKTLIPSIVDGSFNMPYFHTDGYEKMNIGETGSLPNERFRAFIKIQDGCNGNCSYCIIPKLRGSSVSRPDIEIIKEAKRLAACGVKELILTGIETSDYDYVPLYLLIRRISEIDGIQRIRLGSLNVNCITDELINEIKSNEKFCPHLHISLQSGCNRTLNRMRRPYSKEKADAMLMRLQNEIPALLISVDIITSFPGETPEDFLETVEFVKKHRFSHVHSFPYSLRPNTEAAKLPNHVPPAEKKRRNEYLISISDKILSEIYDSKVGETVSILVEKVTDTYASGHTDSFLEARIQNSTASVGDIVKAVVTGHADGCLLAR